MSEHKAGDATQAHAILAELREQMANAYHHGQPLYLQGGNTCRFYGHPVAGMPGTPTGSPVAAGQALPQTGARSPTAVPIRPPSSTAGATAASSSTSPPSWW
ncbi:hypothetical protein V8H18_00760 [Lautropia mirabilis]